jgi:hypothetical protein
VRLEDHRPTVDRQTKLAYLLAVVADQRIV